MPPQQIARHIPGLSVAAPSTAQLLPFNAVIPFNLLDHRLRLYSDNLFDPALFTAPFSWSPKVPLCHLTHNLLRPDHHLPSHLFPWRLDATLHPLDDKFPVAPLPPTAEFRQYLFHREPSRHHRRSHIGFQTAPAIFKWIVRPLYSPGI